jgi:hypothetical protein
MPETPFEMTQRHVDEGLHRIDRQLKLIADLQNKGLLDLQQRATEFLLEMRIFQQEAEEHLAAEIAKLH